MSEPAQDIIKTYTSARKIPSVTGRTPDGTKIPGGPYNTWAFAIGAAVFVVGYKALNLGMDSGLPAWLALLGVAFLTGFVVTRVQNGGRNPINILTGVLTAVVAPRYGRRGGRALILPRPHLVAGRTQISVAPAKAFDHVPAPCEETPTPAPAPTRAPQTKPAETVQPRRTTATLSGVQQLLASLPDHQK